MIINKNYLLYSLYFFSVLSLSQAVDPSLFPQLSPQQIEAAKAVMGESDLIRPEFEELPEINESLVAIESEKEDKEDDLKKFGYDFFSTMPTSLTAVGDLPLPNDYKISLRDQLRVILSGSRDQIFNLNVNLDGTVLFPELGSVYVAGLTFEDVKEKLSNMVNQSYKKYRYITQNSAQKKIIVDETPRSI